MSSTETTPADVARLPGETPRLPPPPVADLHLADVLLGLAIFAAVMVLCVAGGIGDSALVARLDEDRALLSAVIGLLLGLAAAAVYCTVRGWRRLMAEVARRRAAELRIQSSEQRFRDFAEIGADWLWETDARHRFSFMSPNVARALGAAPEAFIGTAPRDWAPDDAGDDPVIRAMERLEPFQDAVVRRRGRDGVVRHIGISGRPVLDPDTGQFLGYRGASHDVSAKIQAQRQMERAMAGQAALGAELRLSEQRFRDFAEASAHYTWECGPDLAMTFISDGITRITGELPEEVLGLPIEERRARISTGDPAEELLRRLATDRLPYMDLRVRRRALDGRVVYLAVSGKPYFGPDGAFLGYRGTGRDVTDEVRAQHEAEAARRAQALAESANTAKSQFLANMSHELRTPLNAILGFSEMIAGEMLGKVGEPRYRSYAVDINASARHLLDIVSDLLDMARIEVGRYRVEPERVRIGRLGDEIATIVHGMAAAARIAIDRTGLDPALTVEVDRRAIKQVLLNLLSNALRHTPEGGRIALSAERRADGALEIAVADTGCGIEPERLDAMFEPFQRSTAHVARQQGGVGLGLWISRELVRLHGGDLTLASRPGQGTTATIVLPGDRIVLAA